MATKVHEVAPSDPPKTALRKILAAVIALCPGCCYCGGGGTIQGGAVCPVCGGTGNCP